VTARFFVLFTAVLSISVPTLAQDLWSLEDCLAIAYDANPTAGKAREQVEQARGGVSSGWSGILPTLSFYLDATRYSEEQLSFYQNEFRSSRNRYAGGLQFSQPIFNGGANWANLGAAKATKRAAEYRHQATLGSVALDVAGAFYGVLRAEALLSVAAEAEVLAEHLLERARAREQMGAASRQEVLQARVNLYEDRVEKMQREYDYASSRSSLLLLLGKTPGTEFTLSTPPAEEVAVPDLDDCLTKVENHPSLRAAEEQALGARRDVTAARAGLFPSLSGNARYGWSDVEIPEDKDRYLAQDYWSVGLTLSMNFFDGFSTKGQIQSAKAQANEALIAQEEARLSLHHTVEVQHRQLQEALAQREVAQAGLELAEEMYRLAEEKYAMGSLSFLDLSDSKLSYQRAKTNLVEAEYSVSIANVNLAEAIGELGVER
jgi:outer membrane protein